MLNFVGKSYDEFPGDLVFALKISEGCNNNYAEDIGVMPFVWNFQGLKKIKPKKLSGIAHSVLTSLWYFKLHSRSCQPETHKKP